MNLVITKDCLEDYLEFVGTIYFIDHQQLGRGMRCPHRIIVLVYFTPPIKLSAELEKMDTQLAVDAHGQ